MISTVRGEYIVHGQCVTLEPATEEELESFKKLCAEYNVEQRIVDELAEYYSQNKSLFGYFTCDDRGLFEWWQDDAQRSIWLGCADDDCFIYDDIDHKYGIGFAGFGTKLWRKELSKAILMPDTCMSDWDLLNLGLFLGISYEGWVL